MLRERGIRLRELAEKLNVHKAHASRWAKYGLLVDCWRLAERRRHVVLARRLRWPGEQQIGVDAAAARNLRHPRRVRSARRSSAVPRRSSRSDVDAPISGSKLPPDSASSMVSNIVDRTIIAPPLGALRLHRATGPVGLHRRFMPKPPRELRRSQPRAAEGRHCPRLMRRKGARANDVMNLNRCADLEQLRPTGPIEGERQFGPIWQNMRAHH
jgi:hypothetical protein